VNTSHQKNIHQLGNKTIGIISLFLEKIEDIFRTSLGKIKSSSLIDGLDTQKAHITALKLHASFVLYAYQLFLNRRANLDFLKKNPVALKVLIWSRLQVAVL